MPAAVVKGIVVSISIIAALGIAVLENPQVQQWLEEQRQRLIVLLRSIGEELDPESRRAAEAFAFEGRTPATDDGIRREAVASAEAAAVATGRRLSNSGSTVRRIPVRGPSDPDEAEERRRKGREYLARRNQQMYEMQERRKAAMVLEGETTIIPTTPTSFDGLVDEKGKLRLLSPRPFEPMPGPIEMREVERSLEQPMSVGESSSSASAFQLGSQLANPFSDEYEMERSQTPRPPVPPKIELDSDAPDPPVTLPDGNFTPTSTRHQYTDPVEDSREELSYEEQLAIALSLSEVESTANSATVRQRQPQEEHDDIDDDELRAAIAASLKDMDDQQAAHAVAHVEGPLTPRLSHADVQPLVDLTPITTPSPQQSNRQAQQDWEAVFEQALSASEHELVPVRQPAPASVACSDELYRVTPELTRARLATLEAQQEEPVSSREALPVPYDPVREAADLQQPQQLVDASFYSAPTSVAHLPIAPVHQQLVDISAGDEVCAPVSAAPSSFGFDTDSESDTFASMPGTPPPAPSHQSDVEVIDVLEDDSDVDMLSEEGDGIVTPDSWTEVGSRDGESEGDGEDRRLTSA